MSAVWSREDPGAGDVAGVRWRSAEYERVATMLAQVHDLMRTHQANLGPEVWSGAAADAFRERVEVFCAAVRVVVDPLAWCATELRIYASTVEQIADEAHAVRVRRDNALEERRSAVARRDRVPRPGEVIEASTIAWADMQVEEADRVLRFTERDLDRLTEERTAADARVQGALWLPPMPAWDRVAVAMQTAGITHADGLTWRGVRTALVDLARRVADGEHGASDELATMLDRWGGSASIMGSALRDLGGRDLADLLTALDAQALRDPARADEAAELQDALRRALALGAQEWDADQQAAFAAALLSGTNAALVVAYLFGDTEDAAMPLGLVLATLDAVHAREGDDPWVWQVDPDAGGIGPMADGLLTPLGDGSPYSVADPAGSLFRQAAGHPADLLDWFTDEDGAERIAYWYGARDWLHGAGWTGPMLAWEALQTIPGALVGPGSDPALVGRLVDVNVGIITAWMEGDDRLHTPMDSEGLTALAGVVESQLPIWLETVLTMGDDFDLNAEEAAFDVLWMGADGAGKSVRVSTETLATWLAMIARDGTASTHLAAGVAGLQADLIASVGTAPGVDHTGIVDRVAELLGAVDGGHLAAELDAARLQDEVTRRQVAVGGLLLGEAFSAAGLVGSVATGTIEDAATAAWADAYATALHDFLTGAGSAGDRAEHARAVPESLIVGWVPAEVIAAEGGLDQYLARRLDEYRDEAARLDAAKAEGS